MKVRLSGKRKCWERRTHSLTRELRREQRESLSLGKGSPRAHLLRKTESWSSSTVRRNSVSPRQLQCKGRESCLCFDFDSSLESEGVSMHSCPSRHTIEMFRFWRRSKKVLHTIAGICLEGGNCQDLTQLQYNVHRRKGYRTIQ